MIVAWFVADFTGDFPGSAQMSTNRCRWNRKTPGHRRTVVLRVGSKPNRVWHFWAASPRAAIPSGHLEGCTVKVRVWISQCALLQVGFDYGRNPAIEYGHGGNNHEAGASRWYFPSAKW